ncbi:ribosome silencing factor [bacterium]|nr:ribosome silencing factor [bacterium]RQV97077.1 MAG: ribosome silencing factor [bacterium]
MTEEDAYKTARQVVEYALTKKAQDIWLMHIGHLSSIADYFVICQGDSEVQVRAIADAIVDGMQDEGVQVWHREGYDYLHWVLLDYVDVVVHVFHKDTRPFYGLERLWGDAEKEIFSE